MTKLHDVRGRITYIASHAKQENLYAVYETTGRRYWTELARCSREEFRKSGTEGKCIEARELIIALPESFPDLYDPDRLLRLFTDRFKEKYGVECVSALHHNKRRTNYHIHLVFSERELLPEPAEKRASRNMFYDEKGRHVRTKKEILDGNGEVRKGCRIVKKGEVYERTLFAAKNRLFRQESFLDGAKHFYTDLINALVKDSGERLHVFDRDGLYLATKKVGRNNPKAGQIRADNETRMEWNREVDRALVSGVPEGQIRQVRQEYITARIRESIVLSGNEPERFGSIVMGAVTALSMLAIRILQKAKGLSNRLTGAGTKPSEQPEPGRKPVPVPERGKQTMPDNAAAYPKLSKIYKELNRQNGVISEAEKERAAWEAERDGLKGFARLTRKGELQNRIARKNEEISRQKEKLSGIARRNGYRSVQDFYHAYHESREAYEAYQEKVTKREEAYGESRREETSQKAARASVLDRLKDKQQKKKTADYQQHRTVREDRGAR